MFYEEQNDEKTSNFNGWNYDVYLCSGANS